MRKGWVVLAVGGMVAGAIAIGALGFGVLPQPSVYVVNKGDTLFEIARDHGVSVAELRTWNDIEGDLIEIGQVLVLWQPDGNGPATRLASNGAKPGHKTHTLKVAGSLSQAGTSEAPRLEMPSEKRCLGGPSLSELGGEDEALAASSGLDHAQVSGAMNGFVHNTLPCIHAADAMPTDTLMLEIQVGCNGLVSDVSVVEAGDWSSDLTACVAEVLEHAPFPAHDLPDGDVFQYPLRFTPG
jgi:LysM repeat protein